MSTRRYNFNHRHSELIRLAKEDIPEVVSRALREDLGGHINIDNDITANLLPKYVIACAQILTHEKGIFCGKDWIQAIFNTLNQTVNINWYIKDGEKMIPGQLLFEIEGPARILVICERTILNFIQTLSGVSTKVHYYVSLLNNTNTKLLDTRKTIPGLRTALKYAVICGGGNNHRIGLSEAFLIKENHIITIGSIHKSIKMALSIFPNYPIEIEVESIQELIQAIHAGADIIMLDNFSFDEINQAIKINNGRVALEVSGNINDLEVTKIAQIGIDYISIGDLTKNIRSIDMSMRLILK
ncbi:nicotinate-nucleotide diphosphorylase [Candidatus Pantoea edessiphila]|uniref:nicotinate-nucleotide diphosphorylase (carboxylating) n=1 Tax=Candidatus Pantoea edessiphila TaxID=2044610 RepID=A0A2P5SY37_9GAMM|nr:carboxylating nicotinate-nucleotide diphosphorylase [Candidatus Pantoea edessiphila]MBK4775583.1 carboxylating nicotinate-nucleotide diphosphorylase [Pantoea sp. Edef]PPI87235.1 nicotinate-nucleotide diphosphorylase [Candidatus Pantoea edessiphila]